MVTPPPIETANLGMADSLILMVLALVVFGPRRLPQIGRQIGKLMYEFRKASNDFKFQMEEELRNAEDADRRKREEAERQRRLALAAESANSSTEGSTTVEQPGQPALPEPSYPRIQPPSTGEPVAAERPGSANAEPAQPAEPAPAEANAGQKEAAADQHSAVTEQAAHNG
jgi:sec-independent protein translocase protein TatB